MAKKRGVSLEEGEKRKLNKQSMRKLGGIFNFMLPYKFHFVLGLIFLVFSSSLLLTFPFEKLPVKLLFRLIYSYLSLLKNQIQ